MADEMKSKLNEQMQMMTAVMYDVLDMWKTQVSDATKSALTECYPAELPGFEELINSIAKWRFAAYEAMSAPRYTYICSCDNELSSTSPEVEDVKHVVCENCGQTDYWLPESEIEADEVLLPPYDYTEIVYKDGYPGRMCKGVWKGMWKK